MYADVLVGQANNKLSTYKQVYLDKELQFWQITFIVIVNGLTLNSGPVSPPPTQGGSGVGGVFESRLQFCHFEHICPLMFRRE